MHRSKAAYRLHLPDGAARRGRLPLLVMLHGCQQEARSFAEGTRMDALADRHGFIVLYPEQSRRANRFGCWNWFDRATLAGVGEPAAIAATIGAVAARFNVDSTRIYVAGMSAGGAMACVLAACHGTLFAACAIHSGVMYGAAASPAAAVAAMRSGSSVSPRDAARHAVRTSARGFAVVPTLVIHGDRDEAVHPVNAEQIVEQVRTIAEDASPAAWPLAASRERRVPTDGYAYRLRDYAQSGRLVLRKVIVEGLGHAWSGGDVRHRFNDARAPDASGLIWDFVSQFRRLPGERSARRLPALLRWLRR
ncbi:MAG: extracellular catalytic domain type 1 short-chain-length polyhydroxyalkanoate depolymerase [Steroidobacteraceae bacterium]